jgi:redox-sensitive bicupin YhaK (pirin superfamily)
VTVGPGGKALGTEALGVLGPGDQIEVRAVDSPARFLLVAGRAIGEPIVRHGPFVMNTRQEILQAMYDYQNGQF